MHRAVEWPLWSAEQIVEALPGLVAVVEVHLADLPAEHLEKNRTAVELLKEDVPGTTQVRDGSRRFVGSDAIRRELLDATSRWATTGIVVDADDWLRLYRENDLFPPKSEHPLPYESMILDEARNEVGYCTSFVYSPVLHRHIGIARVRPDLAAAGTDLRIELAVNHHNTTVRVATTPMPFFDPERKKA